eukprot:gene11436-12786_t
MMLSTPTPASYQDHLVRSSSQGKDFFGMNANPFLPPRPPDGDFLDNPVANIRVSALSPAHTQLLDSSAASSSPNVMTRPQSQFLQTGTASQAPTLSSTVGREKILTKRSLQLDKFLELESNLTRIMENKREARARQAATLTRIYSEESLQEAQKREESNPLTLAEVLRQLLLFFDEELAEDPQEESMQQFPHLKGQASEAMLLAVYQHYCGESGFMSLEQLVEFMEDCAVLQTHAPHNEDDAPIDDVKTALDPVRLLYSVPRLSDSLDPTSTYYTAHERQLRAQSKDSLIIGFSQFYQILLHIARTVYPHLYSYDATVAFNKILLEMVLPLFVWCKGHCKLGNTDILLREERVALVLLTYSPNLWKVFLTYAADAVGKVPEVSLTFPDNAQASERGMYKLPPLAPERCYGVDAAKTQVIDSLIMSETGCLRFARDYGLTPYLLSTAQLREHFRAVNRQKTIVSARLPTREQIASKAVAVDKTKKKEPISPMQFGKRRESRFGTPALEKPSSPSKKKTIKNAKGEEVLAPGTIAISTPSINVSGISFSEFMELVARIAVVEMQQASYHAVFPTPFSKLLAILTVWGVADLTKLEEVRVIRSDDAY